MKNLRKLGAALVLTSVVALSAFAGEVQPPPCTQPQPGQIDTPPCAAAPGDIDSPTGASTAPGDMGNGETSFTEIAADILMNFLPLF